MKKNTKKLFSMALAGLMAGSILTACGGTSTEESSSASSASSQESSSEASAESSAAGEDTWVVGTNAEFPPFEEPAADSDEDSVDGYKGIDMELIQTIAEDNGATVSINNMEFDSLTIALKNGQCDLVIAGMTITDERSEEVVFSDPYYTAKQVMIVREDNTDITKATDMEGKTIAVIQGFTGEIAVQELGYDYEAFKKGTEAVQELKNGKCDVVVLDSATANQYVEEAGGLKIVEDDETFSSEQYGIAVRADDAELLDMVNASIAKLKEDGTIDEICMKYSESEA
ncbi:MAG TPA: basic amino acid ABC transporter substrate-binding protein [Candidatus Alectryocaccobium stercorigallinarum]|nr:basic amino acid ABC transporter substrate-binding protein [Candidatus Alectryocaccobium stercorigallinarum]